MLDIAEGCFVKIAELLIVSGKTVRSIFTKFAVPEIFPDRTVLELLSPLSFLAASMSCFDIHQSLGFVLDLL